MVAARRRAPAALVAALAVAATVLSGCAAERGTAEPSGARTRTPSASPSSMPGVTARPAVERLAITPDGIVGPDAAHSIRVGMPVSRTGSQSAIATWDPEACVGEGISSGAPYSGAWSSTLPSGASFYGGEDTAAFSLDSSGTERGEVDWIVVLGTGIRTDRGIAVGARRSAVEKAYPKPAGVVHLGLSDLYLVAGRAGQLTVEVTVDDGSGYWKPDEIGRVFALSAQPAGTDPVGLVATDNVPGCKA